MINKKTHFAKKVSGQQHGYWHYLFLLVLLLGTFTRVQAQGNCDFQIRVNATVGSCYNNCGISIALLNNELMPLDTNTLTDLSDFKFFCINMMNSDTTYSYINEFTVAPGVYKVGVQAICHTGGGVDEAYIIVERDSTITTTTTYETPVLSMVSNVAKKPTDFGTAHSLSCLNTGRVQLNITKGNFPYTVIVCEDDGANGIPIDTVVFPGRMYSGTNVKNYDYQDYYTVDSLAPGDYVFYVIDGCEYHLPKVWKTIESVELPYISSVCWYNHNQNATDSNVVDYNITLTNFANNYYRDKALEVIEYRMIFPEVNGVADTSRWKKIKTLPSSASSTTINLADTAYQANKYCDLWGKTVKLETRNILCDPHPQTFSYQIPSAVPSNFLTTTQMDADSSRTIAIEYDSCGYTTSRTTTYGHNNYGIYFYNDCSNCTTCTGSSYINTRVFYTKPIRWIYTDTVRHQVIKEETVSNLSTYSYLRDEDLIDIYGDFRDYTGGLTIPLQRTLVDAKGCEIYSRFDNVTFKNTVTTTGGTYYRRSITSTYSNPTDYCCTKKRSLTVYENYSIPMTYNGNCTVELVESPWDNKFNFTATFDQRTRQWTIVKDRLDNTATITLSTTNINIKLEDYCLPSGRYSYRITTPCTTYVYTKTQTFNSNYETVVADYPEYEYIANCTEMKIIPRAGKYYETENNTRTSGTNINQPYSTTRDRSANFQIVSGPTGGYTSTAVNLNGTMTITAPGTYVIRMRASTTYCDAPDVYDTIYFNGGTVEYEYTLAYVCDSVSTTGHARVKGKNGTEPYTYTLYSGPEMTGGIIASNTTGVFDDIPIRDGQQISVKIEDDCMASFHSNFYVFDLQQVQKAWFTDGMQVTEICEGSNINVYAIGMADDVTYAWNGPNGFLADTRDASIFVPRGADEGWYFVELSNTGCFNPIVDSVYVHVKRAADVHIADDAILCPAEDVSLTFTTSGVGDVHYTIAHEENSVITYETYTNNDSFTYSPTTSGIFWVNEVHDDNCPYNIPFDTVTITLKDHIATACDVVTAPNQVCLDSSATVLASSSLSVPYTIRWYEDAGQTRLLKEETITDPSGYSTYEFYNLKRDTTLYVSTFNDDYCELKPGTIHGWANMGTGTTTLRCGESIRFYDSGGNLNNYSKNENIIHTFQSEDGKPLTLTFNSFYTETEFDRLLVFKGDNTLTDSLVATLSGNLNSSLPGPFTFESGKATVWFFSNSVTQYAGWDAVIGNHPHPAEALAKVTDSVKIDITPYTPVPVHYNGDVSLQAAAEGGRTELYGFQWYTSPDNNVWTPVFNETTGDTSRYTLTDLQEPVYVRVVVKDLSTNACGDIDSADFYIPIANIHLELELSMAEEEPCSVYSAATLTVSNTEPETANDVVVNVQLPDGYYVEGLSNFDVTMGDVDGMGSVTKHIRVQKTITTSPETELIAKAQISSCLQGDADPTVVYGDWDYEGLPRYVDEDTAKIILRSPFQLADYHISPVDDQVCYGETAQLKVTSDVAAPQYFFWYTDPALTNLVKTDTINVAGNASVYDLTDLHTNTTMYVALANDNNCPAIYSGAVDYKFDSPATDTVIMHEGGMELGMYDHIKFFDTGGPSGSYQNNEDYIYVFTTTEGVLKVRFTSRSMYSNDNLTIYSDAGLTHQIASITSTLSNTATYDVTSPTNTLAFRFTSNASSVSSGWVAEIVNSQVVKAEPVEAQLNAAADNSYPVAVNDTICYGEDALLEASSAIAFPQVYHWYAMDGTEPIKTDTIHSGTSQLPLLAQESDECFVVTVNELGACPIIPKAASIVTTNVNLTAATSNQNHYISPADQYIFADAGGISSNYTTTTMPAGTYTQTFTSLQGKVKAAFANTTANNFATTDTLFVYDGNVADDILLFKGTGATFRNQIFTSSANTMSFKFVPKGTASASGWNATITCESQALVDTACAVIKRQLDVSAIVSATDDDVCYDNTAHLTATTDELTYPQYYTWWNKDLTSVLLQDTVTEGNISHYNPEHQVSDSLYYVYVYDNNNCPFVPNLVQRNLMPAYIMNQTTKDTTFLSCLDSIPFYDQGGKTGNTSGGSPTFYRIFKAEPGKQVTVHIDTLNLPTNSTYYYLKIYDGITETGTPLATLYGKMSNLTFTSTTGALYMRHSSYKGYMGWEGSITTDCIGMAKAEVSIKQPNANGLITATNDTVCYDYAATLEATSELSYPQYYTWWDNTGTTLLHRDTVRDASEKSVWNPEHQISDSTYRVYVYDDHSCAYDPSLLEFTEPVVFLLNQTSVKTTNISCGDTLLFYDYGGPTGNTNSSTYKAIITADAGRQVVVHIDTLNLRYGDYYLNIYDGTSNTGRLLANLFSTESDITVSSTTGSLYLEHKSASGFMGWEGYITTNCKEYLDNAYVSIRKPENKATIIATNDAVCYDTTAHLTATSDLSYPQYFTWWNSDISAILAYDTVYTSGNPSEFNPEHQVSDSLYWVYARDNSTCPLIPGLYTVGTRYPRTATAAFSFNSSQNNKTTIVSATDSIPFFDESSGNYSTNNANYKHTFTAEEGHVELNITNLVTENGCDILYIYDGTSASDPLLDQLSGTRYNKRYISSGNSLTVVWKTDGNTVAAGWQGYVTTENFDINLNAQSLVTIALPDANLAITATNDTVCYGNEAALTATSTIDYPQYYNWWDKTRTVLLASDTVNSSSDVSHFHPANQTSDSLYYVSVYNSDNCQFRPDIKRDLRPAYLLNQTAVDTTFVYCSDSIPFYDDGGIDGVTIAPTTDTLRRIFKAPEGQQVILHIDTLAITATAAYAVKIYDGTDASGIPVASLSGTGKRNLTYVSTSGALYVQRRSYPGDMGWRGVVYTDCDRGLAPAQVTIKNPMGRDKVTATNDTVCINGTANLTATATTSYPQYYTWWDKEMTTILWQDTVHNDTENSHYIAANQIVDTTYYVTVESAGECPVVVGRFNHASPAVYMNNTSNTNTMTVHCGDSIPIYDFGGKEHNATIATTTYFYQVFQAEPGQQITIHIDTISIYNSASYALSVFDGTAATGTAKLNLYGNKANASYTSTSGAIMVRYRAYGDYMGFEGYVTTDCYDFASSQVTIRKPLDQLSVSADEGWACYGDEAHLTATASSLDYPQYYEWYDKSQTVLLKRDTIDSGSSHFNPTNQISDSLYYVHVYNDENCPYYGEISRELLPDLNLTSTGTTTLHCSDSIPFYDAGGKTGVTPSDYNTRTRIFKAPEGSQVVLHIDTLSLYNSTSYALNIYDGVNNSASRIAQLYGSGIHDTTFVSTSGSLFVSYSNYRNYMGWEGVVYTTCGLLAEAPVKIKAPLGEEFVTTGNDEVCYDGTAQLTASSAIDYPQYYTWYDKDLTAVLKRDTITSGVSTLAPTHQVSDSIYFVHVSNDQNCPYYPGVPKGTAPAFNLNTTSGTTLLDCSNVIPFYDAGGIYVTPSGSTTYNQIFKAPEGAQVILHIDTLSLDNGTSYGLKIYDGTSASGTAKNLYGSGIHDTTFVSTQGAFYVSCQNYNAFMGWEGYVSSTCGMMAEADVTIKTPLGKGTITTTDDEVCYDETANLSASSSIDYPQYYNWWNKDMTTILKRDTINAGTSTFSPEHQIVDSIYYVDVYNDETCPLIPELYYGVPRVLQDEILMKSRTSGTSVATTIVNELDSIPFYDNGGKDANTVTTNTYYYQLFTAAPGRQIVFHIDTLKLYNSTYSLKIYDGTSDAGTLLATLYNSTADATYKSTTGSLYLVHRNRYATMGWEGTITTDYEPYMEDANVKVNPIPEVSITTDLPAADVICEGTGTTLSVVASATEGAELSYQWYVGGAEIAGATSNSYTVPDNLAAGTYQYKVAVAATNTVTGCVAVADTSTVCAFTVSPKPEITIAPVAQICPNAGTQDLSAAITVSSAAPYKYTWSSTDLTVLPDVEQSSTSTTLTATATIPTACSGSYVVKLDVTDDNGCVATQAVTTLTVGVDDGIVIPEVTHNDTVQCLSEVEYPHTLSPSVMPEVTDACGQSLTYTSVTSDTTNADCEGTVVFHYLFEDCAGHTATWDYTYHLERTDNPIVNSVGFKSDSTVVCATLAAALPAAEVPTASDACGNVLYGTLTGTEDVPPVITCEGTRTLTYTYTDCAGKTTDWQFVYNIKDTVGPVFTVPNDTTYYLDAACYATADTAVTHSVPTDVADNCNSIALVSYVDKDTVYGCGSTIEFDRVWRVVDACGNVSKSDSVQHITLRDTIKPTFVLPKDTTICRASDGAISAPVATTGEPTDVADNCTAAPTVSWTDLDTTGTDLEVRTIHRQWTVSDGCNDSVKIQNISILPSVVVPGAIDLTCANDTAVEVCYNVTDTLLHLTAPTVVSHTTGSYTVTSDPADGYRFPVGTTTVTWYITDDNDCGYSVTCTQDVVVTLPPCGTPADSAYIDGYAYSSVRIGYQCWTGENMRHTHYADNSAVDADGYAVYDNDPANDEKFGKLYSWYAAMGLAEGDDVTPVSAPVRGICPEGWAIPTVDDYLTMISTSGGVEYTRSPDTQYWLPSHTGTVPASGVSFLARGAGYWDSVTETFNMLLVNTNFWTNESASGSSSAVSVELGGICNSENYVERLKDWKVSVRCIKLCE